MAATVFDDHAELGGMMRYGIPGYRTPRDVLDAEIKRIIDMGVEVADQHPYRPGRQLSSNWRRTSTPSSGRSAPRTAAACRSPAGTHPQLRVRRRLPDAFNRGRLQVVTAKVVVVGGGDTSIDVASVARRLGHITRHHTTRTGPRTWCGAITAHDVAVDRAREGAEVTLTSLFPVEKMTAAEHELQDAMREGVKILGSVMPLEVLKDENGRAIALRMCECDMVKATCRSAEAGHRVRDRGRPDRLGHRPEGRFEPGWRPGQRQGLIDADKPYQVPGQARATSWRATSCARTC